MIEEEQNIEALQEREKAVRQLEVRQLFQLMWVFQLVKVRG